MTAIKKLPIKKLIKPVKIIIDISMCSYWHKSMGNTYHSAQCTINNDSANTQYYPFQGGTSEQLKRDILKDIVTKFKGLDKIVNLNYTSQALEQGVLITERLHSANERGCRDFGSK